MCLWSRCLGLFVSGLALAGDPIPVKPGKFDVTLTMTMGGEEMATTRTRCILASDLADPELVFSHEVARTLPKTWTVTGLPSAAGRSPTSSRQRTFRPRRSRVPYPRRRSRSSGP